MNKKIFIIYTADNCGACSKFKRTQSVLVENIRKIKNISILYINVKKMADDPGELYHPQFRKGGKWFPGFYLFDEEDFYNFENPLNGHVMGGIYKNGIQTKDPSIKYSFQTSYIIEWIKYNISIKQKSKIKYIYNNDDTDFEYYTLDWYKLMNK
uniref:Thioredoxin-fold protein n=1 Tax=Pithovirus LCPAC102 TaxID=2506587 RepID=A0A4D5XF62_9VIRU|nr:MAG: thioredoxin-fold protein [Pithovirus LCPAC102]